MRTSDRFNLIWILSAIVSAVLLPACASNRCVGCGKPDASATTASTLASNETEMSLKADRSELDALRKDIPEEIKKQNDEIALIMSFIVRDSEEEPNRVRDRFNTAIRKKREAIDKKISRAREDFTKHERADRDAFLKKAKAERDEYLSKRKRSADDRKRFFDDQEDRRKSFFADQADKRKDFESETQALRKDNEDFTREKQSAFNEEWRAYQTRYNERKKQTDLKKQMEQKSRDLQRAGKPVLPVTPAGAGTKPGSGTVESTAAVQSGSAGAGEATPQKDPLADFDKIPAGPGIQLSPVKKGP